MRIAAARLAGTPSRNYTRGDQQITEDLSERHTEDDDIDASEVHVEVNDGTAEACGGVREVENRIRVARRGAAD